MKKRLNADSKNNLALKIKLSGKPKPPASAQAAPPAPAKSTSNAAAAPKPVLLEEPPKESVSSSGGLSLQPMSEPKSDDDEQAP